MELISILLMMSMFGGGGGAGLGGFLGNLFGGSNAKDDDAEGTGKDDDSLEMIEDPETQEERTYNEDMADRQVIIEQEETKQEESEEQIKRDEGIGDIVKGGIGIGAGAAAGAAIGSIFPGLGTLVGAGIGAGIGWLTSLFV